MIKFKLEFWEIAGANSKNYFIKSLIYLIPLWQPTIWIFNIWLRINGSIWRNLSLAVKKSRTFSIRVYGFWKRLNIPKTSRKTSFSVTSGIRMIIRFIHFELFGPSATNSRAESYKRVSYNVLSLATKLRNLKKNMFHVSTSLKRRNEQNLLWFIGCQYIISLWHCMNTIQRHCWNGNFC